MKKKLLLFVAMLPYSSIGTFVVWGVTKNHTKMYTLEDSYTTDNIFKEFDYAVSSDPANGFVNFVGPPTASAMKLAGSLPSVNNSIYLGVERHNKAPHGRSSVRLQSKKSYNHGLFVADISHMPGSICGVWPTLKLEGPHYPDAGRINIIEGINQMTTNSMTLHTSQRCQTKAPKTTFTGLLASKSCGVAGAPPGVSPQIGCKIGAPDNSGSFGDPFNRAGGGIFATQWTPQNISIWFFPRASIPHDLEIGVLDDYDGPQPYKWPTPMAHFELDCPLDAHFRDMKLVIDTKFCGDWAGGQWGQGDKGGCRRKAVSCEKYVSEEKGAFETAFWVIKRILVFRFEGDRR